VLDSAYDLFPSATQTPSVRSPRSFRVALTSLLGVVLISLMAVLFVQHASHGEAVIRVGNL
jgi:hypothetical protein